MVEIEQKSPYSWWKREIRRHKINNLPALSISPRWRTIDYANTVVNYKTVDLNNWFQNDDRNVVFNAKTSGPQDTNKALATIFMVSGDRFTNVTQRPPTYLPSTQCSAAFLAHMTSGVTVDRGVYGLLGYRLWLLSTECDISRRGGAAAGGTNSSLTAGDLRTLSLSVPLSL
ncbi:hypothetical protein J6590_002060 [Homalodisca vitripennis]|nr:hypothetical protein J6590_002060 [Homalodisca vitripennis]